MTIHDPSLRAALKTLKLTGMLDTLDARLAQTRDGKLGHLEFLQVLCEDEIARRETAALAAGMAVFGFHGGSHCRPDHADALRAAGAIRTFDDMRQLPEMIGQIEAS